MVRLHHAIVTLGFAGCADPAFYLQRVYTSEPRPGALRINAPGYQMDFPAEGIRLPSSFMLSDSGEVLAPGACPFESLVGIALYPGTIISADMTIEGATSDAIVTEQGTGVVQVSVPFRVPHLCPSMTVPGYVIGTSTFTFFPSSRIARRDSVAATNMPPMTNPGCGCAPTNTDPFVFTSYWKFNTDMGDVIGTNDTPILADGADAPASCAAFGEDLIALRWTPAAANSTRISDPLMMDPAVVYDLFRGSSIDATVREVSSSLQVGFKQTRCADVHQGLVHPPITIADREISINADGIYEDLDRHDGPFEILANDGNLAPFAVRLDIGNAKHVRVSRSEGSYSVQPSENGGYLFWFDDGMFDTETITIEPY